MDTSELWLPVVGYEGLYEVSNMGNVRSIDRVVTSSIGVMNKLRGKPRVAALVNGYLRVCLCKNNRPRGINVHRLVAEAWIQNEGGKETVNHKNGIKTDNRVENLEWFTYKENNAHAKATGLNKCYHEGHHSAKLTEQDRRTIVQMRREGATQQSIAERFGVSQSTISDVIHNRTWSSALC